MSKSFTKAWWKSFHKKTQALSAPAIFRNALEEKDMQLLDQHIVNAIRNINLPSFPENKLLVSLDEEVGENGRKYLFNHLPLKDETFIQWCTRVFHRKKFGIILNGCQNYDIELKKWISVKFKGLLSSYGVPNGGLEITLFFGNYGFTPIGFHIDPLGYKVTHLHLGPGGKDMYLIEKNKFESKFGTKSGQKEYNKLIPESRKFSFGRSDVFYMPNEMYHVGYSEELSFALTIWHIDPPIQLVQQKLIVQLGEKIFKQKTNDLLQSDTNSAQDISQVRTSLNRVIGIDQAYKKLPLSKSINELLKENRLRLHSNGFFSGYEEAIPDRPLPSLTLKSSIRGVEPFVIYTHRQGNKQLVFVQGKVISIPYNKSIERIIESINGYHFQPVDVVFKLLLTQWPEQLILGLCQEIHKWGGLESK